MVRFIKAIMGSRLYVAMGHVGIVTTALGGAAALLGPTGVFAYLQPWSLPPLLQVALFIGLGLLTFGLTVFSANWTRSVMGGKPPEALPVQSGKKGAKKIAPYRLAIDTVITWLYRRKEWTGLSADGRYREPAPAFFAEPFYQVLKLQGKYEPPENVQPEPNFEGPSPSALGATVTMTGSLKAVVIPGPGSPTLPQASYETEGRRHFAFDDFGRQPKAIRFSKPEDRLLRSADLPFEMPCGRGRIVVEKFYPKGIVIDEDGTSGDPVAFIAYFDEPEPASAPLPSVLSLEKAPSYLGGPNPARLGLTASTRDVPVRDFQVRLAKLTWLPLNGSPQEVEILPGPIEWEDGVDRATLQPDATRHLWLIEFLDGTGPWLRLRPRRNIPNSGRYVLSLDFEGEGFAVHHATYEFDFMQVDKNLSTWSWV